MAFRYTAQHATDDLPSGEPELADGWRTQLPRDLGALVEAWRDPQAWQGESMAGGVTMPSAELAVVAVDELVVHAWDLARSTGQDPKPADADVAIATGFAEAMSTPQAAEMRGGIFGPLVDAPDRASPMQRLLALTGRSDRPI